MTRRRIGLVKRVAVSSLFVWVIATSPAVSRAQVAAEARGQEKTTKAEAKPGAIPEDAPSLAITIPDEPKTIDPATLIPPQLAAKATVKFTGQPLKEIVKWLQDQSLHVSIDYPALASESILVGEPISDHLDDAPIYLLLNRLRTMSLDWYFENDTILITTQTQAEKHLLTVPYNVGDLLDTGYTTGQLANAVTSAVDGKWQSSGDEEGGGYVLLGDVMFVRQSFSAHQEVTGLLAALRKHGKRTFICDPISHERIRETLTKPVSVDFVDVPLNAVIKTLAEQAKIDIRIHHNSLAEEAISDRTLITLKIVDRPLVSVLQALKVNLQITWILRDGVLWIMTVNEAESDRKAAVFDVRDLCRDSNESSALTNAVISQSNGKWISFGDEDGGTIVSPKLGVLVIRQTERALDDISQLLDNYRAALRASKRRPAMTESPDDVMTRYYRMERDIASDLQYTLVELIEPTTWKSPAHPDAKGLIRVVASNLEKVYLKGSKADPETPVVRVEMIPNSVLIVTQTRRVHKEIEKVLRKVENGEPPLDNPNSLRSGMGGMGGGMGGGGFFGGGTGSGSFGGGYFSVPSQ